jgi:hypothetical protein
MKRTTETVAGFVPWRDRSSGAGGFNRQRLRLPLTGRARLHSRVRIALGKTMKNFDILEV